VKFYNIKKRLFVIITNNVSNNSIITKLVKTKLFKELSILWNLVVRLIFCIIYIIQLVIKEIVIVLNIISTNNKAFNTFNKSNLNNFLNLKNNTVNTKS
jgi:hypothetical protein